MTVLQQLTRSECKWTSASRDATVAADWVHNHASSIQDALARHGAVLFRGFPLNEAEDFSRLVRAFTDWTDLPYSDSLSYAVRLPVCDRVCTTNEGKSGGMVFHHEQAQAPLYPSRLFFYCHTAASTGGGTGICPSFIVYDRLRECYPAFIADCERKGVVYTAILPEVATASTGVGRSWRSFFSVATAGEAEARMRALGYTYTWLPSAEGLSLRLRTPVLPAVKECEHVAADGVRTVRKVFFNQMIAQYLANAREFAAGGAAALEDFLTFGDGSHVPTEPLEFADRVCAETAVELQWQAGDVALLDNMLVMHARRAFEGPRRVLASLVK